MSASATTSALGVGALGRHDAAVLADVLGADVEQPEHDAAVLGLDVEHRPEQRVAVVDEVVGQQDGQRLAGREVLAAADGVTEPARVVLVGVADAAPARSGRRIAASAFSSPFFSSAASSSSCGEK